MRNSDIVFSSTRTRTAFAFPRETSAWWAFLSSVLGGLLMVRLKAPERFFQAGLLAAAMAGLYLSSDWVSSLSGKGYRGDVPRGSRTSLTGWFLVLASMLALIWFHRGLPQAEIHFWFMALTAAAVLVVLMFLLRLEMVPLDARLLLLSSMLCTLPALFLGFVALGPQSSQAWFFWAPAALFFPSSALFAQAWLRGKSGGKPSLATMALPLLALFIGAVAAGLWGQALFSALYIAWQVARFVRRISSGGQQLPAFSEIRGFGREQAAWMSLMTIVWMWTHLFLL